MIKQGLTLGAFFSALAAHALKSKIDNVNFTIDNLQSFDTASKYQLFHGIAIIIVFVLWQLRKSKLFNIATICFVLGILFFSGSIYFLSTRNLLHLGDSVKFLGPITPLGGLFFITGWLCILIEGFKWSKELKN